MDPFVSIATGLDVRPALDELARYPDEWVSPNGNGHVMITLAPGPGMRALEAKLPETWALLDAGLNAAAACHDGVSTLSYARLGRMPPGFGMLPHRDGIDGRAIRRYQLALVSEPGVALTVGGETRCPQPGELWQIDVSQTHSVTNDSRVDRLTLLFDTVVD